MHSRNDLFSVKKGIIVCTSADRNNAEKNEGCGRDGGQQPTLHPGIGKRD